MNGVHYPYTREKFNSFSLKKKVEILKFRRAVNKVIKLNLEKRRLISK